MVKSRWKKHLDSRNEFVLNIVGFIIGTFVKPNLRPWIISYSYSDTVPQIVSYDLINGVFDFVQSNFVFGVQVFMVHNDGLNEIGMLHYLNSPKFQFFVLPIDAFATNKDGKSFASLKSHCINKTIANKKVIDCFIL